MIMIEKIKRVFGRGRRVHEEQGKSLDEIFDEKRIDAICKELEASMIEYDFNLILCDEALEKLKRMKLRGPSSSDKKWFEYADRLARSRISEPPEVYDGDKALYRSLKRKFEEAFIPEELSSSFIPAYVDYCQDQFALDRPIAYVLSGDPGCGKTESSRLIGELSGLVTCYYSCPRLDEYHGINGETGTFTDGDIGIITRSLMRSANPLILLDEPEKCPRPNNRAGFADSMLTLLDGGSREFVDNNFGYPVRTNQCIFFLCCNDPDMLSRPLLDRCTHLEMPTPTRDRILGVTKSKYNTDKLLLRKQHIILPEELIEHAVDELCADGIYSFRQVFGTMDKILEYGDIRYYESELDEIEITKSDVERALLSRKPIVKSRVIGF